jgi:hypothetical protein
MIRAGKDMEQDNRECYMQTEVGISGMDHEVVTLSDVVQKRKSRVLL